MIKRIFLVVIFSLFLVLTVVSKTFAAGSLTLDPASTSAIVGKTFSLKVMLSTGSDLTGSTDIVLLYPPSLLEIQSVTDGALYPTFSKAIDNTAGKLNATGAVSAANPSASYQGSGVFATIVFKAKAIGSASVSFDCTSGPTDSNITKKSDNTDILSCSTIGNGSYIISASGGVGTSPTQTVTPTPVSDGGTVAAKYRCSGSTCIRDDVAGTYSSSTCSNSCSEETLPESGAVSPLLLMLAGGAFFVLISMKLFAEK